MKYWRSVCAAMGLLALSGAGMEAQAQSGLMASMDLNKDGRVAREEARLIAESQFIALDINLDQYLDIDEFAAEAPNTPVDQLAQAFIELDTDADSRLSIPEFLMRGSQMFVFIDVDKDGFLTAEEIRTGSMRVINVMRAKQQQFQQQQ